MPTLTHPLPIGSEESAKTKDKRLDDFAWGLFLLVTGGLWLLPAESVPPGAWSIGTGLILLGLNTYRHLTHRAVSSFTTVLGVLALAGGLAQLSGVTLPLFALCLVLLGAGTILRVALRPREDHK